MIERADAERVTARQVRHTNRCRECGKNIVWYASEGQSRGKPKPRNRFKMCHECAAREWYYRQKLGYRH